MKKIAMAIFFLLFVFFELQGQNIVTGIVVDNDSEKELQGVQVSLKNTSFTTQTTSEGCFTLLPLNHGNYILQVKLDGYETQHYPIEFSGTKIDLGTIQLFKDASEFIDLSTIILTDDELNNETIAADNITGLLQSSKDIFVKTAAFEFSSSFFKIRGLDSDNGTLLINGIPMNKLYNGRPQWSNWGGLNDVLRNQEFSFGLAPSSYAFGGVLGATNINVRASHQKPGTRITYTSSDRSYTNRLMISHSQPISKKGWAYTISASRRTATEGFSDGTNYYAHSFFASIEKKFRETHSLSFTSFLADNTRGKAAPKTDEVFKLKGNTYNSYWGFQEGKLRNSRVRHIFEPIVMLHHDWNLNTKTSLNTNISYQFGNIGNSRIDANGSQVLEGITDGEGSPFIVGLGASNPDPTYYQKLPSYALKQGNRNVYEIEQSFKNEGQLSWNDLYTANLKSDNNGYAAYVLYEDRNDDHQLTINTIFDHEINDAIAINGKIQYTQLRSENYAKLLDLLGGQRYLDIDRFATTFDEKQNNLLNPLHKVGVGDRFKYHFNFFSNVVEGFTQAQVSYPTIDFYVSGSVSQTSHQREGLFQNGGFKEHSLGKSEKLTFFNFGGKLGGTYKVTGRHLLDLNAGYLTKAPNLRNSFSNSRENNFTVEGLTSEKIMTTDLSYLYRSPMIKTKLTGFYTLVKDATEISFFFAEGISGDHTAFVQEILTGIDKLYFGTEFGIEANVSSMITLKSAISMGQYTYHNNPNIYITSELNQRTTDAGFINGKKDFGKAHLKNYKLAAGPQTAISLGFEYRDPNYWFFGATANFFDATYIDIAPLTRTSNFADDDGIPFTNYDPIIASAVLQQEQFDSYTVLNLIGGKSFKIKNQYISLFASVGNLLNTTYKIGGFEQGRNANYQQLKEDKTLETPVFGNKYWWGRGTTYFLNINYNF